MLDFKQIKDLLAECLKTQSETVARWHELEPERTEGAGLADLVLHEHLCNFRLWHVEDEARRKDVDDAAIAACKRRIDGLNQARNDAMEKVDAELVRMVNPLLPKAAPARLNSESPAMILDRLSIMALKIFHMREQAGRSEAGPEHVRSCAAKLAVLEEQRGDLGRALMDLLADYERGAKVPKIYRQFKMYNDPKLNPQLYGGR